ncbi:MAG TPA: TonB family protein [Polyangia bacterium]|nr:TonB family protein [Polyangia bacterium]
MNRNSLFVGALLLLAGLVSAPAQGAIIPADKLPESPLPLPPPGPEATYLTAVHNRIHGRWTDNFLRLIGEKLELNNPLNVPDRVAEIDLVIATDGQLISSQVSRSSGFPGFDDAVLEILRDAVPYPRPPVEVRSDDGATRLHWMFARDQRRDSGISVRRTYDPVATALPRLLQQGRRDEALNRVVVARGNGEHVGEQFTLLALDWLKASLHQPWTTARMAKLMAARGDADAIKWLKQAVRRPELAASAGEALSALKIPVCPLVKDPLENGNPFEMGTAATALATAGEAACLPGLAKLLATGKLPADARAAAATAMGVIDDPSVSKALKAAMDDNNPMVKSAALLAQVRPGSGRGKVYLVEPFLRDPQALMRAAAAAGVVRAGGDANLADLYVLFKENDVRPCLAALKELEHLQTQASTELIARLMHRPQPDVQRTAADILIRRGARDSFGAFKTFLEPSADPAMRGRALVAADDATLQTASADPRIGIWVFRALMLRGQPDLAADWFIAHGSKMSPDGQADAMADWVTYAASMRVAAPAAPSADQKPTAAVTTH